jgi:hypothetical protein
VEADRGTSVTLAADGLAPELSLMQTPTVRSRSLANDRMELTLTLEVAAFLTGDLTIPPIRFNYAESTGATGVLEARQSLLVVNSVLPDGEVTLKDLKPQAEAGSPPAGSLAPVLILATVALTVVGLVIWKLRRRQPLVVEVEPEPDTVVMEDVARAALDKAGREFAASNDYTAYYLAIGMTVRNYLSQRFDFAAFALTTSELQERMVRNGVDRWQARLAGGLLDQCDAVIYAQYRPARERADADLTAAYEIIEMSRPYQPMEAAVT